MGSAAAKETLRRRWEALRRSRAADGKTRPGQEAGRRMGESAAPRTRGGKPAHPFICAADGKFRGDSKRGWERRACGIADGKDAIPKGREKERVL